MQTNIDKKVRGSSTPYKPTKNSSSSNENNSCKYNIIQNKLSNSLKVVVTQNCIFQCISKFTHYVLIHVFRPSRASSYIISPSRGFPNIFLIIHQQNIEIVVHGFPKQLVILYMHFYEVMNDSTRNGDNTLFLQWILCDNFKNGKSIFPNSKSPFDCVSERSMMVVE